MNGMNGGSKEERDWRRRGREIRVGEKGMGRGGRSKEEKDWTKDERVEEKGKGVGTVRLPTTLTYF